MSGRRRLCAYCFQPMGPRGKRPNSATVDHVLPKSRGGDNSPGNRVPACYRCNTEKGSMTGDEYRLFREHQRRTKPDPSPSGAAEVRS